MAAFNKFHQFVEDIAKGVHNLDTGVLKVMLTNTAPSPSNAVRADLTEIPAGAGYSAGGSTLSGVDAEQVSGTLTLAASDLVFTASGGAIGPFRYAVLYNDTPTSPADPLIGWWDYGSSINLAATETFTVDFGSAILTLA